MVRPGEQVLLLLPLSLCPGFYEFVFSEQRSEWCLIGLKQHPHLATCILLQDHIPTLQAAHATLAHLTLV